MTVQFLDRQPLVDQLNELGLTKLSEVIGHHCSRKFQTQRHGSLSAWKAAWQELPDQIAEFDLLSDRVTIKPNATDSGSHSAKDSFRETLKKFHPWRKGPWSIFGVEIDSEWQSNLKWNRLCGHVEFRNRRVLDIGCGNGYFGWRMLGQGAQFVLGCEPFLLSIAQHEVFRKYWPLPEQNFVVPLADGDLPRRLGYFDIAVSMGVLYHHSSPISHLQTLWGTLRKDGQLLLETLVLEGDECSLLMPEDRYAKMRNVWFIPTVPMLERWLRRTGFRNLRLLDVTPTTNREQRRTPWMTFESLDDFLLPSDPTRTVEGYPAPTRAMFLAQKRS